MSSVPESERQEGRFNVLIDADNLASYTIQICCNKKVFLEQYQNALTNDIINTAKDIFIYCFEANGIKVNNEDSAKERLRMQVIAIRKCNRLLALMQMAKKLFHLDSKRIKYWGGLTIKVRTQIKNWHESDCKRYK